MIADQLFIPIKRDRWLTGCFPILYGAKCSAEFLKRTRQSIFAVKSTNPCVGVWYNVHGEFPFTRLPCVLASSWNEITAKCTHNLMKLLENNLSLRTSAHAGVAIPQIFKLFKWKIRVFSHNRRIATPVTSAYSSQWQRFLNSSFLLIALPHRRKPSYCSGTGSLVPSARRM